MKSKILFIYPDIGGNSISFSPAIEILSSFLKKNGFNVELIHIHDKFGVKMDYDDIAKRVKAISPNIVGISATTYQYEESNKLCMELKKSKITIPIILGGIGPTISPEKLAESYFDGFAIGEGEIPLMELLTKIENGESYYETPGFHFKVGDKIIKNPMGKIITNLDVLPIPDYEIMNTEKILPLRDKWLSIAFSRGCLYSCNFCINQKLKKMYPFKEAKEYFRTKSASNAIKELLYLANRYAGQIEIFNLDDDLIIMDKQWFYEFAHLYKKEIYNKYGIKYAINGRANLLDEEMVKVLKDTGCWLIRVGFETGNNEMRNLILKKGISDQQLRNVFSYFHKYNLRSLAFAMIGIPKESLQTIYSSIDMLTELRPTLIRMAIFEPFIGTPLYDYCIKNNLIKEVENHNCFEDSSLLFDTINGTDIRIYSLLFPWYLNKKMLLTNYSKDYCDLIDKYVDLIRNGKEDGNILRKMILEEDRKISNRLKKIGIEHFEYFSNNAFYYHYYSLTEPLQ